MSSVTSEMNYELRKRRDAALAPGHQERHHQADATDLSQEAG